MYQEHRIGHTRVRRLLKKGKRISVFFSTGEGGGANHKKIQIWRPNSLSDETLHEFAIICPARRVRSHPF